MPKDIVIKKGLDIKIGGRAEEAIVDIPEPKTYAIKPEDFHGITPRLEVKVGDSVRAGDALFSSKENDLIKFVSPVSGTVEDIKRGEKRRLLEIIIASDAKHTSKEFEVKNLESLSASDVKNLLLNSGCWPFIKQRPYDVIANPEDKPRDIFISAYATSPLSSSLEFSMKDSVSQFQKGVDALVKLTEGKVHISVDGSKNTFFKQIKGAEIHNVYGPHPAGNVGVQIHNINPINRGQKVWVVSPQDVALIGKFFETGVFDATRVVAFSGPELKKTNYYRTKIGAQVSHMVASVPENSRVISGDVFTGTQISSDGYLGYYSNCITIIPEGNTYRLFGWMPFKDNNIYSFYGTSLSRLLGGKKTFTTSMNGEQRALVVTGKMEKVMPLDIYPMQLLKECMAQNIEKMESLGIYEVAPEDFALIDYISTSKLEAQEIIREALDLMIKEVG